MNNQLQLKQSGLEDYSRQSSTSTINAPCHAGEDPKVDGAPIGKMIKDLWSSRYALHKKAVETLLITTVCIGFCHQYGKVESLLHVS